MAETMQTKTVLQAAALPLALLVAIFGAQWKLLDSTEQRLGSKIEASEKRVMDRLETLGKRLDMLFVPKTAQPQAAKPSK